MPRQRPMGDDDDEDLMLVGEDDEQEGDDGFDDQGEDDGEPGQQEPIDEEPDHDDEPEDEPQQQMRRSERRAQRRKERAARAKENAIKQRLAMREAKDAAAKAEREAAELRRRLAELEATSADDTVSRLDQEIAIAEDALNRAYENGETKDQAKAARELARLEARKLLAEETQAKRKAARESEQTRGQRTDTAGGEDQLSALPEPLLDWVARVGYTDWNKAEQLIAVRIGNVLQQEGYSDTDPDYLIELDKRLKARLPHRYRQTQPVDLRQRRRTAAPPPSMEERAVQPRTGPKRPLKPAERDLLNKMHNGRPTAEQINTYLRANPTPLDIA